MASSKRPKTLLDILPAEVRYRIYELAVLEDAPINTSDAILAAERHDCSKYRARRDGKKPPPPPNDAVNSTYPRLQPALLATCRQIRHETYAMYHTENTFSIECAAHIKPYLARLNRRVLVLMRPLHVTIAPITSWPQASCFFERLAECPWEKQFCALPIEVAGEGTVYTNQPELHRFEEVVSYKWIDDEYGGHQGKVYEIERKA